MYLLSRVPQEGGYFILRPTIACRTFIARQELRIEWSACRRIERISLWSGENNRRTFYYQIDLWISSRDTYYRGLYGREHAVMLYPPLSVDVSRISRALRERRICLSLRARSWSGLTREERVKAGLHILFGYSFTETPYIRCMFYGTPGEHTYVIPERLRAWIMAGDYNAI